MYRFLVSLEFGDSGRWYYFDSLDDAFHFWHVFPDSMFLCAVKCF